MDEQLELASRLLFWAHFVSLLSSFEHLDSKFVVALLLIFKSDIFGGLMWVNNFPRGLDGYFIALDRCKFSI